MEQLFQQLSRLQQDCMSFNNNCLMKAVSLLCEQLQACSSSAEAHLSTLPAEVRNFYHEYCLIGEVRIDKGQYRCQLSPQDFMQMIHNLVAMVTTECQIRV